MAKHALVAPEGAAKSFPLGSPSMVRPNAAASLGSIQHDWDCALMAARAAEQARAEFQSGPMRKTLDRHAAGLASADDVSSMEERFSELASAEAIAVEALCYTPAPDLAAISFKIAEARRIDLWDSFEGLLEALAADLQRQMAH